MSLRRARRSAAPFPTPLGFLVALALGGVLPAVGCQSVSQADPGRLEARYMGDGSRLVDVAGLRVHLRDEGEGPPLLLLHGAVASLHSWDAWAEVLRTDHRVLRIDLPPFGLTGPHPAHRYDPVAYVELVDAVLDQAGVEEAVLAGNSLGGYIAARYAAERPGRVRGVVLVSPAGYPQPLPWALRLAAMPGVGEALVSVTPRWVVALAVRDAFGDPDRIPPGTVERYHELLRGPGNRDGLRHLARVMEEEAKTEPAWVGDIRAPVLLLWGEEDTFTPVEQAALWSRDLRRAEVIVLEGVGHVAHEEVPERTLRWVRPFLLRSAGCAEIECEY
jgi:pimeloyl-ACP methyl ester carboxylesterase